MKSGNYPLIFDVHRFALDDGPGIRTTVFFKGCPLSCIWCHNPESMRAGRQIAYHSNLCVHCGACVDACPEGIISMNSRMEMDRSRCSACGKCADACPSTAIRVVGEEYPVDVLLDLVMRDRHFFDVSGGGVTFSGGEPTLWMPYLEAVLKALREEKIHTAIQTCGMFDASLFSRKVLPFVDLVMFDLKIFSEVEHSASTGHSNRRILENFRWLARVAGSRVLPRVPLVPGITATPGNLAQIASFLSELGYAGCELLSFNPGWAEKWDAMGMNPNFRLSKSKMAFEEEQVLRNLFCNRLMQNGNTAAV
jgi:pyruvate formate lyase activating enzyme